MTKVEHKLSQVLERSRTVVAAQIGCDPMGLRSNVRRAAAGHNSCVVIVDFYRGGITVQGSVCVKYASGPTGLRDLERERSTSTELKAAGIRCPTIFSVGALGSDEAYSVMEVIDGVRASDTELDCAAVERILLAIRAHDAALRNRSNHSLGGVRDFSGKLHELLAKRIAPVTAVHDLSIIDGPLNSDAAIASRTISTDRSAGNMIRMADGAYAFIDFSTQRMGSRFDNVVQFIDDPRARFRCSRQQLQAMVMEGEGAHRQVRQMLSASAVYTNLLQCVFTYKKDPALSTGHLRNTNLAYASLSGCDEPLVRAGLA